MKPLQIRIALLQKGYTNRRVAQDMDVSDSTVANVIHGYGSSIRIANKISAITGHPVSRLWPGRYERALTRKAA